jgi:hypothetical protein
MNADETPVGIEEQLTEEEARAIMLGGLGRAELEFVTSLCTPLYWAIRTTDGKAGSRNGTSFFLDAGQGPIGVTCAHVIDGWVTSQAGEDAGPLRLGGNGKSLVLDWNERAIDIDTTIDIATFKVEAKEVEWLGKTVLTGYQKVWPPAPPLANCGVYYCGYPGVGTRHPSNDEVVFGAVPGSGVVSSLSERDVSTVIEREHLMPVLGGGLPPENFDFGGMSGGPMLMVIQEHGFRSWALAGVIYQGPNVSDDPDQAIVGLEIIRARRAHFILADGRLDANRWGSLNY